MIVPYVESPADALARARLAELARRLRVKGLEGDPRVSRETLLRWIKSAQGNRHTWRATLAEVERL